MREKKEVSNNWFTLAVANPRAAIIVGSGIIIMTLSSVIVSLYKERKEMFQDMVIKEEACNKEKMDIYNNYILKYEELNARYSRKLDDLHDKVEELNKRRK